MKTQDSQIITLQEVADLTRYDLKYLNNNYLKIFSEQGVRILRIRPGAKPRFLKSEIMSLLMRAK